MCVHVTIYFVLFQGAHKIYLPPSAWAGGGGQTPTRPTVKQILAQFSAIERVDKMPREVRMHFDFNRLHFRQFYIDSIITHFYRS